MYLTAKFITNLQCGVIVYPDSQYVLLGVTVSLPGYFVLVALLIMVTPPGWRVGDWARRQSMPEVHTKV